MITPFVDKPTREVKGKKVISYGLTSYGYDMRVGDHFQVFGEGVGQADPLNFSVQRALNFESFGEPYIVLPPGNFALCHSIERFNIPRDVLAVCYGKSTYARCGLYIGITPLEPEWEGQVTIEIANVTKQPIVVYSNQGISQVVFHQARSVCETSYKDKGGKYQGQSGITHSCG